MRRSRIRFLSISILILALVATACSKGDDPGSPANRPPTVELTAGPVEGEPDQYYRVHFEWSGQDPDGEILRFEYLMSNDEITGPLIVDENIYDRLAALGYEWTATENFGGDFVVAADQAPDLAEPADSIYVQEEAYLFHAQHSFFVRAVDEEGAVSAMPAHRGFTATSLSPRVLIGSPQDTGPVGGWDDLSALTLFRWQGVTSGDPADYIAPDSSRFALFARADLPAVDEQGLLLELPDSAWSPWRHWEAGESEDPVGGTHARIGPLAPHVGGEAGQYLFFVQAKDAAGAVTSHFIDGKNLRRFKVRDTLSPRLSLTEQNFGSAYFYTGQNSWNLTVFEGFLFRLNWVGSADHYGGEIDGYRFAWNLPDSGGESSWTQWSLDHGLVEAELSLGTHRFHLECRDLAGNVNRVDTHIHVIPLSMDYPLAFIDDYDNGATENPAYGWPEGWSLSWRTYTHSNADMEDWWNAVLADYTDYLPARDHFRVGVQEEIPPMAFLGNYRRVIWEVKEGTGGRTALGKMARFRNPNFPGPLDYISLWFDIGGQMLLCGSLPVKGLLPMANEMGDENYERKLPMMFEKALVFGGHDTEEEQAARDRFLPKRWFGVESVTQPVDQTPKHYDGVTGRDMVTYPTHWGMVGAGFTGASTSAFGNSTGWTPPDSLRFSPEVYEWLAEIGPIFNDPDDGCAGASFYGLDEAEIYNWDWFGTVFSPPVLYDDQAFLPLLSYLPADPTIRWGAEPVEEHCFIDGIGDPYREIDYTLPSVRDHWVGLVGMVRPEAPNVLLGFPPFYLSEEDGRGLIGHVLTDIMGMER
jgi:hypothetical protein